MLSALEALVMDRRTASNVTYPPPFQRVFEQGERNGQVLALRDALVRLTARAGLTLSEEDRARIQACEDVAALDRWLENVLGAKTAADVFG